MNPNFSRLSAVLAASGLLAATHAARGQSADALIDKLVDKGILTVDEANQLREDADRDFTKAYSVKSGLPDWVTSLRFNGDVRGRFEGFYADHPGFADRARWRYRLRAGFTAVMLDDFEVGFRLGSGDVDNASGITRGTDPISNNQTFQNNAGKKGVFLDTVYARWSPINTGDWQGVFTLGKMENPLVYSDLTFDHDYTPEGLAEQFTYTLSQAHSLKFNAVQFVLDELGGSGEDPYLLGGQMRWDAAWTPKWSSSVGATFHSILNEQQLTSGAVPDINMGNSRSVNVARDATGRATGFTLGAPVEDFQTLIIDAGVTYNLESVPLYTGAFPIRVFGEYLHNFGADRANDGFQAGISFGKAGKRRTWEITYRYKVLEGDVWWEELTDSDSGGYYEGAFAAGSVPGTLRAAGAGYGSGTNIRGHWVRLGYSPYDSLSLNLTWISLDLIDEYLPGTPSDIHRLQVDAIWKF
ncbi:MAG: putative porin [Verrucomicrobiales bacterium]|nr:putative porin [Verrucomicrobiales bacterium]